ncbi:hypothetical protein ACFL2Y_02890, partial [Candidatus Omnitrophota bacterium]
NDYYKDKLIAIGMLEIGKFDMSLEILGMLMKHYIHHDDYAEFDMYKGAIQFLKERADFKDHKSFIYLIGDAYIQNKLFNDANEFFTQRILNYGINQFDLLNYLQKEYQDKTEIKEKVWGEEIYVTIENFEEIETVLTNWVSRASESRIRSHYIDNQVCLKGKHSEWFDVFYLGKHKRGDFDCWIKSVNIPLSETSLKLGIRFYLKKIISSEMGAGINVIFPKNEISGSYSINLPKDKSNDWYECRINDLYDSANTIAKPRNWSMEDSYIDKIIISTSGSTNKFYIDEIELFILND